MRPLRILVFSASFGAGHLKAAEGLIQALKLSVPAVQIYHEDFMGLYNQVLNKTIKGLYIKMIKRAPRLYGALYQGTQIFTYDSVLQRLMKNIGRKQLNEYIARLNVDIIICTYPYISGLLAHMKTKGTLQTPLVTVITDYSIHSQWVHPGVDLYIVGNAQVRDGLIKRGIKPETIAITGIPVSPKFDRALNRTEIRHNLGIRDDRLTFLIMGGAYGVLDDALWICRLIADAEEAMQAVIVCGNDKYFHKSLDSVINEARNPVIRFGFVNNIEELMTAADVIITKAGGLTVSEALTKYLPMIIFKPIPGQEADNAHYIEQIGAGKIAHSRQEFLDIFYKMVRDDNSIHQMRESAARECLGNSAARAVECILHLLNEQQA